MQVLVFNAGSSSLKFGIFSVGMETHEVFKGSYERFRSGQCEYRFRHGEIDERGTAPFGSPAKALKGVRTALKRFRLDAIDAIGHRIVHGGTSFSSPTLLDEEAVKEIEALTPLAPLHIPANLEAVRHCREFWPNIRQVAVFDTAFHSSNPTFATTYAVPAKWREAGLRRFGFHGTSHKYVAQRAADEIGSPLSDLMIVSIHLGNGASVCAIKRGQSMDSSMGMTPLEGLVMGTRSGDVDPGAFGFLSRELGLSVQEIENALYDDSGLKALAGSSDMRDIEERAGKGDAQGQIAIDIYAYRARKYVGAYAAAMGGLDAVVFTGGIGENSPSMRRRICDGLDFMGLQLDYDRNRDCDISNRAAPQIQTSGSRVRVIVTETQEQLMIAKETADALAVGKPDRQVRLPIAVSARHVHLSRSAVDALFGKNYALNPAKPLRQPGNWLARERVSLIGPKGTLEHVAILGPLRKRTQVEVSRTDSFVLGIDVPIRNSGELDGTPQITINGPNGSLTTDGLIIAARHIHTNPIDAARMGIEDGEYIQMRVGDTHRDLTFGRTLVRVGPNSFTEMHIDTDEANAAHIDPGDEGELLPEQDAVIQSKP